MHHWVVLQASRLILVSFSGEEVLLHLLVLVTAGCR